MKKIIAFILIFSCICGYALAEDPATPTDLYEIDDDDWGEITITFERQVYIVGPTGPVSIGDEITLTAILVNFKPEDILEFFWQYSTDEENWYYVEANGNEQTYTFIITLDNYQYWYRVIVRWEEGE